MKLGGVVEWCTGNRFLRRGALRSFLGRFRIVFKAHTILQNRAGESSYFVRGASGHLPCHLTSSFAGERGRTPPPVIFDQRGYTQHMGRP